MKIDAEFISHWEKTLTERKLFLEKHGIQKYFEEIPALAGSSGYRLFLSDFAAIYPQAANQFFEKWTDLSTKIVRLCVQQCIIPTACDPAYTGKLFNTPWVKIQYRTMIEVLFVFF